MRHIETVYTSLVDLSENKKILPWLLTDQNHCRRNCRSLVKNVPFLQTWLVWVNGCNHLLPASDKTNNFSVRQQIKMGEKISKLIDTSPH